jgi:hypothetical protein
MSDNVTLVTQHDNVKAKSFTESQGRFARDPAAASAAGKKGGPRARAAVQQKNRLRRALAALLDAPAGKLPGLEDAADALRSAGVSDPTGADAVVYMQLLKAGKGDTEAARFVRDTVGERPSQSVELSASERTVDADAVADLTDDELAALADDRREALPAPSTARDFPAIVAPDVAPEEV